MKKVTVIAGSPRKRHTYAAAQRLASHLRSSGEVEAEVIQLSDCHLEPCRGCQLCFERGEEHCPLKDDRDMLLCRMAASDGVVLATPNYSFQVSGLVKTFLDRLGFVFHRPRFFGKAFTCLVVEGIYGGAKIVSYLHFAAGGLGFNTVKGISVNSLEPMTDAQERKIDASLAQHAGRFAAALAKPAYPVPSPFRLMVFRMSRTTIRIALDGRARDYGYYDDKGWFESDYYYPTRLGVAGRLAGSLFDAMARSAAPKRPVALHEVDKK